MNAASLCSFFGVAALALFLAGCNKAPQTDAAQSLQQSFQSAEPEARKTIETVSQSFKSGNYSEAARTLTPMIVNRPMTDAQKQAVGAALQQLNQAIVADPKLDTKEMYELRAKMFQAVQSGPRF